MEIPRKESPIGHRPRSSCRFIDPKMKFNRLSVSMDKSIRPSRSIPLNGPTVKHFSVRTSRLLIWKDFSSKFKVNSTNSSWYKRETIDFLPENATWFFSSLDQRRSELRKSHRRCFGSTKISRCRGSLPLFFFFSPRSISYTKIFEGGYKRWISHYHSPIYRQRSGKKSRPFEFSSGVRDPTCRSR